MVRLVCLGLGEEKDTLLNPIRKTFSMFLKGLGATQWLPQQRSTSQGPKTRHVGLLSCLYDQSCQNNVLLVDNWLQALKILNLSLNLGLSLNLRPFLNLILSFFNLNLNPRPRHGVRLFRNLKRTPNSNIRLNLLRLFPNLKFLKPGLLSAEAHLRRMILACQEVRAMVGMTRISITIRRMAQRTEPRHITSLHLKTHTVCFHFSSKFLYSSDYDRH
jgi:hypothetical protein